MSLGYFTTKNSKMAKKIKKTLFYNKMARNEKYIFYIMKKTGNMGKFKEDVR